MTPSSEPVLLLSSLADRQNQVLLAGTMLALSLLALALMAPHAARPMTGLVAMLPAYAAAVLVIELVTSTFLLAISYIQRSRAILILAAGYLFSGTFVAPWVLERVST